MADQIFFVPPGGIDPNSVVGTTSVTLRQSAAGMSKFAFNVAVGQDPGEIFYLGVNVHGAEQLPATGSSYAQFPDDSYFQYLAHRGIKSVRLTGRWESFQPNILQALDSTYVSKFQAMIQSAQNYGLAVVVEPFHNSGTRLVAGTPQYLGDSVLTPAVFADAWARITTAFSGNQNVIAWDLMNTPSSAGGKLTIANWIRCAQAAISAIRTVEITRQIWVQGLEASAPHTWATLNPNIELLADPSNKIYFSAHVYMDRDCTNTHFFFDDEVAAGDATGVAKTLDESIGVQRLAPFVAWAQQKNVNITVGQTAVGLYDAVGSTDSTRWSKALNLLLNYCRNNEISVHYWGVSPYDCLPSADSAGNQFTQSPNTLNPTGTSYLGGAPALGSDRPQLSVLLRYLTDEIRPTSYSAKMTINGTSAVIAVTIVGYIDSSFTFDFNDGGAGGSFPKGATVEVPIGPNYYVEIPYAFPSGVPSVQINISNTGDLVGPNFISLDNGSSVFDDSVSPTCVVWPKLIVSGYTGPAITLLKSDGTATKDFSFSGTTVGDSVDPLAVSGWDSGTPTVKTYHDQTGKSDLSTVSGANGWGANGVALPSQVSDYPALNIDAINALPFLRFGASGAANRMDSAIAIDGLSDFTLFVAVKLRQQFGADDLLVGWNNTDKFELLNNGNWVMSAEGAQTVPMNASSTTDTNLHLYAVRFNSTNNTGTSTRTTYLDGVQIGTADNTVTTISDAANGICNVGWNRWVQTTTQMDLYGFVAIAKPLSDTQLSNITKTLMANLGINTQTFGVTDSSTVTYKDTNVKAALDDLYTKTADNTTGIDQLLAENTELVGQIDTVSGNIAKNTSDIKALQEGAESSASAVSAVQTSLTTLSDTVGSNTKTIAANASAIKSLNDEISGLVASTKVRVQLLATTTIDSYEVIGSFVADSPVSWADNFPGSVFKALVPPNTNYVMTMQVNGSTIGSIQFDPTTGDGTITATAGTMKADDVMTFVGSVSPDDTMENVVGSLIMTVNTASAN